MFLQFYVNLMERCFFSKLVGFLSICNMEDLLRKHTAHTCTRIHDELPPRLFFFIHCAINHFSFSQTLTTRSEMLFLALNVLLWSVAVRPYSSYFLHPAGVVSRLQNPSSSSLLLHWAESTCSFPVSYLNGLQKDVLLAALLRGSAGITVSSSELGHCGRLCKLEISSS